MEQIKANSPDRQKSSEKAEAILEGAMQEFLANGYAAASMDRIAAAAGVSKATVYSHFQDKEKLFNALIERLAKEKYRAVLGIEDCRIFQEEPNIVLTSLARNMLGNMGDNEEHLAFIRLIIAESGRFPELAKAFVSNLSKTGLEVLTRYLESRDELELKDPEAIARIIIGGLVYFVILQEMLHGKEIVPMASDRLIDSLIYLIANKKTER